MPSRRRFRLLFLLLALIVGSALGCVTSEVSPQLLNVLDLVPREADLGDRLEVVGTGFPEGRPARITFRGTLNRPGRPRIRAAVDVRGASTSADRIEMVFSEGVRAAFCGKGDEAAHTTFEGDVVVSFPASSPGALPITGELKGISVDFRPPAARRAVVRAREDEGQRALDFMGLDVAGESPPSGGLVVTAVRSASRADLAGILPGDVIARFDGVRVLSKGDLSPSGASRSVAMTVRRAEPRAEGGAETLPGPVTYETVHQMPLDGYEPSAPANLLGAGLVLLVAAAIFLLLMGPAAGVVVWAERTVIGRMQPRVGGGGARRREPLVGIADGVRSIIEEDCALAQPGKPVFRFVPYLVFVAVSSTFCAMSFGQNVVAADFDIPILFVIAVSSLLTTGFLGGGLDSNEKWSLLGAFRSAVQTISYELPGAIALVCIVMMTGSLRARDIVTAQGGWPWEWFVFRTPFTFGLFFVWMATALAEGNSGRLDLLEAETGPGSRYPALHFADWANIFVVCGIASALFLGGWQIPGRTYEQEATLGWQCLGAVLFQIKSWLLVLAVIWIRSALPRVRIGQLTALCWKYLVPASVVAFVMSGLWMAYGPAALVQTYVAIATFALSVILLAWFALRIHHGLRATHAQARLNPFL